MTTDKHGRIYLQCMNAQDCDVNLSNGFRYCNTPTRIQMCESMSISIPCYIECGDFDSFSFSLFDKLTNKIYGLIILLLKIFKNFVTCFNMNCYQKLKDLLLVT